MAGNTLARFPRGEGGLTAVSESVAYQIARKASKYSLEAVDVLVDLMRNAKREQVRGDSAKAIIALGAHAPNDAQQEARTLVRDADQGYVTEVLMSDGE